MVVTAPSTANDDIHLWRHPSLKKLTVLRGATHKLASIRAHPDGKSVLTSTDSRTVTLWDLRTGKPLVRIADLSDQFAQLSRDGKTLYFSRKSVLVGIPLDLAPLRLPPRKLLEQAQKTAGLCSNRCGLAESGGRWLSTSCDPVLSGETPCTDSPPS